MAFERIVIRTLPDGSIGKMYPFHLSLQGQESLLLCRDTQDFDALEKTLFLSARSSNCIVIIHIVMSNHAHCCLLAKDLECASRIGELIKKRHSQYLSWKYGEKKTLIGSKADLRYLDSDWYVRNALAYVVRNALDICDRIEDYPWSGYRALFRDGVCSDAYRAVSALSYRERALLFRTHDALDDVPWILNRDGFIEPASASDWRYLESAFCHDQAFFLKSIGSVNVSEITQKLEVNGRMRLSDSQILHIINDLTLKWFGHAASDLTPEQKARVLPYLMRSYRTSAKQLARCLQMPKALIDSLCPSRKRTSE